MSELDMGEDEVEVRCVCPICGAEGKCIVDKERAKELKEQDLLEEHCIYGGVNWGTKFNYFCPYEDGDSEDSECEDSESEEDEKINKK